MKLSLVEDNTVILQVDEDRSSLPPRRKKPISQADVLEEQHKALKLQQEMLELKKKKASDGNSCYHEHCKFHIKLRGNVIFFRSI